MKNIGITMRLICYPLEIQHGHNFRVTNQSFQFIVNFFGHLKMCFISIVIFCDNTKVQEINSLKPSSLSWIFFCSSYAVSLKVKKSYTWHPCDVTKNLTTYHWLSTLMLMSEMSAGSSYLPFTVAIKSHA